MPVPMHPVNRISRLTPYQTRNASIQLCSHRLADHESKINHIQSLNLPPSFFVYGTLRDDDDSGAPWTAKWCSDISHAYNATVYGFKMFKSKRVNYPFALKTNNPNDVIIGRMITFKDKDTFYRKLIEADQIEDYDDFHPEDEENEYVRDIVDVHIIESNEIIRKEFYGKNIVKGIMYYQKNGATSLDNCDEVPNGNWMDRYLLISPTLRSLSTRLRTTFGIPPRARL